MTLVTTEAILLRSHPYSDSSRILRFLTRESGIVSLIGKGVRARGSRGAGALESFAEGAVTFFHRSGRDLHTLKEFERTSGPSGLGHGVQRLVGASLVAEILLAHAMEEGDPELFGWVRFGLRKLGTVPGEAVTGWTLAVAWRTLGQLGFTPRLDRCVVCGEEPFGPAGDEVGRFDTPAGGVRCPGCSIASEHPRLGPRAGGDLAGLVEGCPPGGRIEGAGGHVRLLEEFAVHHLAPRKGFQSLKMMRTFLENG